MAPAESTPKAVKEIPERKERLRKTLEELKSLSASLSSFTHKWEDLENHLAFAQSSIDIRLRPRETPAEPAFSDPSSSDPSAQSSPESPSSAQPSPESPSSDAPPTPRPELLALCSNMDGRGLLTFVRQNYNVIESIRAELSAAIQSAPDPARLVLVAVSGLSDGPQWNPPKDSDQHLMWSSRLTLLELMCQIRHEVRPDVANEAKKMAMVWKDQFVPKGEHEAAVLPVWAFLRLVGVYGITAAFYPEELLDAIILVANQKSVWLLKWLGLENHINSLIEKLIIQGKATFAVPFICGYNLEEKYPPVPLLKNQVEESKRIAKAARKKGKGDLSSDSSRDEATYKEIAALTSIISVIKECELESEYPIEPLEIHLEYLKRVNMGMKRRKADACESTSEKNANKHSCSSLGNSLPAVVADSPAPPFLNQPQPYMPDRVSYLGSARPYDMPGVGLYDRTGSRLLEPSVVRGSRLSPSKSYVSPLESYIASSSLERALAHARPVSYDQPPLSFDRLAAYDRRPTAYERPPGYGKYGFS